MGEERGAREGRASVRNFAMDIPASMESQSSRSISSQNLAVDVEVRSNHTDLLPSSALTGHLRQRALQRKQSFDREDSSHDEIQDAIEVLDTPLLTRRILGPTEFPQEGWQNIVNSVELEERSRPLDRRRFGRQLRPLRQGGIAGVAYDDIYLAIGVAATALFIIETLYKTYQLYNSAGRSLEESSIDLIEAWPWPS